MEPCMSLARALEILGPFRAGFTRNGKLYLDGNTDATEAESNTSQI